MSKLLINEHPFQFLPSLAIKIGVNEAIILQQLHYWLEKSNIIVDNKKWIYNTFEDWHKKHFPFWSLKTVKRVFLSLQDQNLLEVKQLSKDKFNKTNYYTINYLLLEKIDQEITAKKIKEIEEKSVDFLENSIGSIDRDKMTQSTNINGSIDRDKMTQSREGQNYPTDRVKMTQSYIVKSFDRDYLTETTTEILSPKPSLKQKKEEERSFDKSLFLKFIEDTRKVYKGNGDRNWFPTLFDYQNNQIGVDSNGHLYVKGTGETLQPSEAQNLWEYIFKHKEQIVSIEHQIENHRQKIIQELRSKTLSQGDQAS